MIGKYNTPSIRRTSPASPSIEVSKRSRIAAGSGIHILGPVYFGMRQVNLKPTKKIEAPADMAGMKLRMPGSEAWQFLGEALGANPTPRAYTEVYTGLQTGAIDGQDNPLPNDKNMKFYEVTSQIVLTSDLVGYDLLAISNEAWDALSPDQQAALQAAADEIIAWSTAEHLEEEAELVEFFKQEGLDVYTPDVDAFRQHAQQMYLESEFAADWPEGMLERINAMWLRRLADDVAAMLLIVYALEVHPGDIGASAGLACDASARVLDAQGAPIDGLYACGNDMESIMAGRYPGPGITLGRR